MRWCLNHDLPMDTRPIIKDKLMIPNSIAGCAKNSKPKSGNIVIANGNKAQCTAHNNDTSIPK